MLSFALKSDSNRNSLFASKFTSVNVKSFGVSEEWNEWVNVNQATPGDSKVLGSLSYSSLAFLHTQAVVGTGSVATLGAYSPLSGSTGYITLTSTDTSFASTNSKFTTFPIDGGVNFIFKNGGNPRAFLAKTPSFSGSTEPSQELTNLGSVSSFRKNVFFFATKTFGPRIVPNNLAQNNYVCFLTDQDPAENGKIYVQASGAIYPWTFTKRQLFAFDKLQPYGFGTTLEHTLIDATGFTHNNHAYIRLRFETPINYKSILLRWPLLVDSLGQIGDCEVLQTEDYQDKPSGAAGLYGTNEDGGLFAMTHFSIGNSLFRAYVEPCPIPDGRGDNTYVTGKPGTVYELNDDGTKMRVAATFQSETLPINFGLIS